MRRSTRRLLTAAVILLAVVTFFAKGSHQALLKWWLERAVNARTEELFDGSVRLGRVHLDRRLRIAVGDASATLRRPEPVALHIDRIESRGPVTDIVFGKPWELGFAGARFAGSSRPGVSGVVRGQGGDQPKIALEADVESLGLNEFEWISRKRLGGSTGELTGVFRLTLADGQAPELDSELRIDEPGGLVQSKLFELLTPYLPNAEEIRQLSARTELVHYREARVELRALRADQLKMFLHIDVPAYNLIVNLNLDIHVDDAQGLNRLLSLGLLG